MQAMVSLLPIILMVGIFWFMIIRPQKKQQEKRQEMLSDLRAGDKITTIGGIKGVITKLNDAQLTLKVAPDVEIEVTKSAIGRVDSNKKKPVADAE